MVMEIVMAVLIMMDASSRRGMNQLIQTVQRYQRECCCLYGGDKHWL